jgi:single-stranded DNA-binding protein
MVVGTVEADAYMGSDGQPRSSLNLRADTVQFLSTSRRQQTQSGPADQSHNEDNIPF